MKNKPFIIILSLLIILAVALAAFWYYFTKVPNLKPVTTGTNTSFQPFGTISPSLGTSTNSNQTYNQYQNGTSGGQNSSAQALRLLSDAPVGGYGASTTASNVFVRFVDRGRGNIYEARSDTNTITTLSNTVVPMIYDSFWNKNLTSFVGMAIRDSSSNIYGIYASLLLRNPPSTTKNSSSSKSTKPATTTIDEAINATTNANSAITETTYMLKGKNLPSTAIAVAVSPTKDKIVTFVTENGGGSLYISGFDGSSPKKLLSTPLTEVNIDWPESNTIAITTKGSANAGGFLYFVNVKTGAMRKILGPINGLSAVVSHDAKYVLYSTSGSHQDMITNIYTVAKQSTADATIRTLADKCAWGNFYKSLVYCGVPTQAVPGTYPDDWYLGKLSTVDKIWQVNGATGEVKLVSNVVNQSDRLIDAFHLGLDAGDNYLYFMNKNDLSLWSLDLVASQ